MEMPLPQASSPGRSSSSESRFSNLRGVRWRINLGILPCLATASIDELRREAADSRRRYASLRRRLLVDPHLPKDGNVSPDLVMDNPLSQNPDSTWGRFFRNAELEKMVDQDLSRLYPEHGSYFQTSACQAMLRRILLLWCLRHPEYGYRQGMHELLAPLLYVLHIDVQHLSEVRSLYEDYFNDDFDAMSFPEGDLVSNYRFTKAKNCVTRADEESSIQGSTTNINSLDDLDPETRDMFLLSDAYGPEGELGIVLSERFMEHDAYCMFDNLMNGACGVVAMAEFFSPSPAFGSSSGLPPVIEASSSLYHLLFLVDPSLHSHLVELAVEPQYFALRWLRVLFGREFSLENLLVVWDEIFSSPNGRIIGNDSEYSFRVLCSPRGAFISTMAVSMLLHLRSSLLATEHATACLQRLLNFPENINVKKLIEKARSLQALALESNISLSETQGSSNRSKLSVRRGYSLSSGSDSPKTPLSQFPDSYWEEKWRVLHREEAIHKGSCSSSASSGTVKGALGDRYGLCRTESDPSPVKVAGTKKDARSSVRRSLLDDLSRGINSEADLPNSKCDQSPNILGSRISVSLKLDVEKHHSEEVGDQDIAERTSDCIEETCLSGENSSVLSTATSPQSMGNDHENESEKSSVTSNSFIADNDEETDHMESCSKLVDDPVPQGLEAISTSTNKLGASTDEAEKQVEVMKERKPLSGKFQWFWKFGRGSGEGSLDKGSTGGDTSKAISSNSSLDSCGVSGRTEVGDQKVMGTLKNLGQSMLENIQVIESVFQHDRGQSGSLENLSNNILGSKGQAKAMAALKELRKISNLLSEM